MGGGYCNIFYLFIISVAPLEGQYDARDGATGSPDTQRTTTGPAEQNEKLVAKEKSSRKKLRANQELHISLN
jgi:hypothetical protein